ncbi:uncharacterized protein LOC123309270 [Coccinella septempunctata]|uniref:uncharacterized protein LOC123309270 n=1 Tax=Coccinella septempunctata TaxID=41139 RepID=UPI001D07925C|nr:uncharacterized protein LOC123309270 [Coccinella septempunctata]
MSMRPSSTEGTARAPAFTSPNPTRQLFLIEDLRSTPNRLLVPEGPTWFTDASVLSTRIIVGIVGPCFNLSILLGKDYTPKNTSICCESQATPKPLSKEKVNSYSVRECKEVLRELGSSNVVNVIWCRAHSGRPGNEKADILAMRGGR